MSNRNRKLQQARRQARQRKPDRTTWYAVVRLDVSDNPGPPVPILIHWDKSWAEDMAQRNSYGEEQFRVVPVKPTVDVSTMT